MAEHTTPLVITWAEPEKPETFENGAIIVFVEKVYGHRLQGRVKATCSDGTIIATVRGLRVPQPYEVGMVIPTDRDSIVAW